MSDSGQEELCTACDGSRAWHGLQAAAPAQLIEGQDLTASRQPGSQPGSNWAPRVHGPFQRSFLGTSEYLGSRFSLGSQHRLPVPFNARSFLPVRRLFPV